MGILVLFHDKDKWVIQAREVWKTTDKKKFDNVVSTLTKMKMKFMITSGDEYSKVKMDNAKLNFKNFVEMKTTLGELLHLKQVFGVGKIVK